jgi:hypothetical protein
LFEQLAVVVEEARNSFAENQLFDDSDAKMSFAYADAADNQESVAIILEAVFFDEATSGHARPRQMGMRTFEFKIRELAMLVALGNTGRRDERICALLEATVATHNPAIRTRGLPPTSTTNGTNFRSHFHEQSLKIISALNVHCGKRFAQVHRGGMAVHILWSYGKFVEN